MNNQNTPYNCALLDLYIGDKVGTAAAPTNETEADIANVSVVGALFDKNHNLFDHDLMTIERALAVLTDTNFKLKSSLKFHFYNLIAPLKSDFLKASLIDHSAPKSDALIVCGVWGGKSSDTIIENMPSAQREQSYSSFNEIYKDFEKGFMDDRLVSISSLQVSDDMVPDIPHEKLPVKSFEDILTELEDKFGPLKDRDPAEFLKRHTEIMKEEATKRRQNELVASWSEAANRAGVKFVVTMGPDGIDAINTDDFLLRGHYRAAIKTTEKFEDSIGLGYGLSGSLGFLVQAGALESMKSKACPDTLLGQRILAL